MGLSTSKRSLSWFDYTFVWCEERWDERCLPSNWVPVRNVTSCDECETLFHSISSSHAKKGLPIVLIVHESLSKEVIPRIYSFSPLNAIYIYDPAGEFDGHWFQPYEKVSDGLSSSEEMFLLVVKVRGAVTTIAELIAKIEGDHNDPSPERIPFSFFDSKILHRHCTRNLDNALIYLPYLISRLYESEPPPPGPERMDELLEHCRNEYRENPFELKRIRAFERSYSSKRVLRYFLKESFVTRLFQRVLQRQDLQQLRFFHFFITDLQQELQRASFSSSIRVYKGQWMSKEQWKSFDSALGEFGSIDDFWLTEMEKRRACRLFDRARKDLVPVLFKIDADPRLEAAFPFANVRSWTKSNENVVLFMIGSVFQIVDIYEQEHLSIVKLKFCSTHHDQLRQLTDEEPMRAFGHVLFTLGRFDQAQRFYENLLTNFPKKTSVRLHCYQKLALIADERGDFPSSVRYYQKVLHRHEKESNLGAIFASLGDVYRKDGDYARAHDYLNRAIDYWQQEADGRYAFELAVCSNNLGIVYEEEEDYDRALSHYRRAYDLRRRFCSYDQISLGISWNNLAGVYTHLAQYEQAFLAYHEALKIYRSSLPDRHPKIGSTLNNLGALHERRAEFEQAAEFYEEAREIYRSIFRCENANLLKIESNLERVRTKVASPVVQF